MPEEERGEPPLTSFHTAEAFRVLGILLKEKYGLTEKQLQSLVAQQPDELSVPLSAFEHSVHGILETVCRFLKEQRKLNYHEIGKLISRDERTVWASVHNAIAKSPDPLHIPESIIRIPVSVFNNRKLSPLQSLVLHLSSQGLTTSNIATTLRREYFSVWSALKSARRKMKNG